MKLHMENFFSLVLKTIALMVFFLMVSNSNADIQIDSATSSFCEPYREGSGRILSIRMNGASYEEQVAAFRDTAEDSSWSFIELHEKVIATILNNAYDTTIPPTEDFSERLEKRIDFSNQQFSVCKELASNYLLEEARKSSNEEARPASSVMVQANCTGITCIAEDLTLNGPSYVTLGDLPGGYSGIHPHYDDFSGSYGYSIKLGNGVNKVCLGRFNLNGSERNVFINVQASNCEAYIHTN